MSHDSILRTKLFIPPFKSDYLPRPQLTGRIDNGMQNRLVLITAPAGYGNSTLTSEWVSRKAMPTAWLSLDQSINDAATFLKYIIASLQTILPGFGEGIQLSLSSSPNSPVKTLAYTFVNKICELDQDFALVLDDFHTIVNLDTIQLVSDILHDQPPRLHLLIASRSDLPFSYHRLLARGEMTVLGIDELRFKPHEAHEYLKNRLGEKITLNERELLNHQTEGWIAGLQMAAISIRSGYNHHTDISSFSGKNRYVSDYLMNEVLQNQKPVVTNFLIQTSMLDKFNASLCDRVTGQENSQSILEYLEQTGLFLIPLDHNRTWYRYHHLFADLLRSRLENQHPDVLTRLHRRAAVWFEEYNFEDEAITHWLAAHEYQHTVAYLNSNVNQIMAAGKWSAFLNWLEQIPDIHIMKYPLLLAHQVFLLWEMGCVDKFFYRLKLAEEMIGPIPDNPTGLDVVTIECHIIMMNVKSMTLTVIEHNFDFTEITDNYNRLAQNIPDQFPLWKSIMTGAIGLSYQGEGKIPEAIQWYGKAMKMASETGMVLPLFIYSCAQSVLLLVKGQLARAIDNCETLLAIDAQQNLSIPFAGLAYAIMGEMLYIRGDLETAARHTRYGIKLISNDGEVYTMVYAYYTLARIYAAQSDEAGVFESMDALMNSLLEMHAPQSALIISRTIQAQMWTRFGHLEKAANWLNHTGLNQINTEEYPNILGCSFVGTYNAVQVPFKRYSHIIEATIARVELALGRADAAIARLDEMLNQPPGPFNVYYPMQLQLLKALALHHANKNGQEEALLASIRPVAHEQYYQLYIDEGQPMYEILSQTKKALVEKRLAAENPDQIIRFIEAVQRRMISPATADLTKSNGADFGITAREKVVLEHLARGLAYDDIARLLVVSPNTIKTHIYRLYRKMGVSNRLQAIKKGNEAGWLKNIEQ